MTTLRRLFGFIADATAGGKSYDQLTAGAIPDADKFYKVGNVQIDDNIDRDEINVITAERTDDPPNVFTAAPVVTVQGPLFFSIARQLIALVLGVEGTITGAVGAAQTHPITPLPWGSSSNALKARHLSVIRDDQYDKVAGATLGRLQMTFPLDGHATFEAAFHGKYKKLEVTAPPSASYTGHSPKPLYLRDTQVFVDGAGTSLTNLAAFEFEVNNGLNPKHWPMRNRVPESAGSSNIVWWPAEIKLGARLTFTYRLGFHDVDTAQETKRLFAKSQKLVTEVLGAQMATTPVANEMLRFTQYAAVPTGGGAEALTPTDDISSSYEGGSFYSSADGKSVLVEVVDDQNVAIIT